MQGPLRMETRGLLLSWPQPDWFYRGWVGMVCELL